LRVLTFNSHQPYLHTLAAAIPWHLGIIEPHLSGGPVRRWDLTVRPLPPNVALFSSLEGALREQRWDWILTHNVQDLLEVRELPQPKVFLVHGTLSGRILQDRAEIDRTAYLSNLRILLESCRCRVVYISKLKQDDWGLPGDVVRTAIDPAFYGGYRGEKKEILQVCNNIRERGAMLGWKEHRQACIDYPALILGVNGSLPRSRKSNSWEDLKEQYRAHRLYLHTAKFPYEDGYNLAMLEAMATGMPVAVLDHPSNPIRDGVDGIVGSDGEELRHKISCLMEDYDAAVTMGKAARRRLAHLFPLEKFRDGWNKIAESLH
jgi:glycosyltransferase involved in cell wall biosynthesis